MRDMKHALLAEYQRGAWAVKAETTLLLRSLMLADAGAIDVDAVRRARAGDEPDSPPVTGGVAVLPLHGVITPRPSVLSLLFGGDGGGLEGFRAGFRAAMNDEDVSAIVLAVDSPGGSVDLVDETATEIRKARGRKPIVAVANTEAASAGYWIASQADDVVVTPSGSVGSIGVFALHWDESGLNEKMGVVPTFIAAGEHKTEGNPHEPLSDDAKEYAQSIIDDHHGRFVDAVAKGRGVPPKTVRTKFGQGRMMNADAAVDAGLADRVDTYEATVAGLVGAPKRRRAAVASQNDLPATATSTTVSDDEVEDERGLAAKSPRQVKLEADQALIDEVIATH